MALFAKGAAHPRWKGGVKLRAGYRWLLRPDHPRADNTGYVGEHILVVSDVLGRPLPQKHPVHHINECGTDNDNTNLVVCESPAYHKLLHLRTRARAASGNPVFRACCICRRYDDPNRMAVNRWRNDEPAAYEHAECRNRYARERRCA